MYRILHVKLYAINPDFKRGKTFACKMAIHREGCFCHRIYNFGRLEMKLYKASPAIPYAQGCVINQEALN